MQVKKHMKPAGRQTLGLLITNISKQLHEMSNVTATAGPYQSLNKQAMWLNSECVTEWQKTQRLQGDGV